MKQWTMQELWKPWMSLSIESLALQEQTLNSMNVFPVADADTGSNMLATLCGTLAPSALEGARCALDSSRGNSGTLLSVWLKTLVESLGETGILTPEALHYALFRAWEVAQTAVSAPAEGTMLTVMHTLAQAPVRGELEEHFPFLISEAAEAAFATQKLQQQAREAHTFDAGAVGLALVVKAWGQAMGLELPQNKTMGSILTPGPAADAGQTRPASSGDAGVQTSSTSVEIVCTVQLSPLDMAHLRSSLDALGDSVVIAPVDQGSGTTPSWRVHVHVPQQDKALQAIRALAEPENLQVTSLEAH
ncbi:DAK2 domain-containing protein [Rothia amarae]|uniref:DAK2 domain-containing protein n=1 Tax=Rothia amarae TaxID=169480 RepID=A0A7H2BM85_9MICC|nr:DAK2 domain-containing protein [Rothia amarae]QNV40781.1 DAK2 domain-containing protein [Rothia amarae]